MARLLLSFLGTFQVQLDQNHVAYFRSANNQGLLIYLALNKSKPIARDLLATLFWPEETEKKARHNLRQSLYRLRGLLEDHQPSGQPFLLVTRQSVQFNPTSDYKLDVEGFLAAIEVNDLNSAVTQYGGDLLPGFTCDSVEFEDWLRLEREHLHQLALETLSAAAQEHLQAGRLVQAQELARRQLKLEPWREQAYRRLMQVYALAGDRANALAQYELCRQQLWENFGVDPAPETQKIFEDIKAGRLGKITAQTTIHTPPKVRHNLPAETTPFIGREEEMADVQRQLTVQQQRLLTILGPGGIGKTRLGLAVAADLLDYFQDGVYFVDLSPLTDAQEMAPAVAAVLNYQAPDNREALLPQLIKTLSRKNLLLILDNFEQVSGGAAIVSRLLQRCPHLSLLVTSRQPLNLASENRCRLAGLRFPDLLTVDDALAYTAVQLFVDSGGRVRSGFELTAANVVYVLHICRLVQGMPLALILAASWLELLTTAEIAGEIEKGLDILTADLEDLPARQRSMRAVFERSWGRLQPEEQQVLARLTVFRGGFSREAAQQVADANLRILLSLANKSFLQRQPDMDRYAMHELLRQFTAEQLEQLGEGDATRFRHCHYFAQLVPVEQRRTLFYLPLLLPHRYAADRDNFQHAWNNALSYGYTNELTDLANGMIILNTTQGIQPTHTTGAALSSLRQLGVAEMDERLLKLRAADLRARQTVEKTHEIKAQIIALIQLLEQTPFHELRYWLCVQLAFLWRLVGTPGLIDSLFEAGSIARGLGDEILENVALAIRLWGHVESGQREEGTQIQLRELLPQFEIHYPDSFVLYAILRGLSLDSAEDEKYTEAISYGTRALNTAKQWKELFWISTAARNLTEIWLRQGLPEKARLQLLELMEWHVALGQDWQMLGFIGGSVLLLPQTIGDDEMIVTILSMMDHHPELTRHNRHIISLNFQRLQDTLGDAVYEAAWERGKELDIDQVVAMLQTAWG